MSHERITAYVDICPVCEQRNMSGSSEDCYWCGWPMGKDWATVEVDLETHVIVRTVVPAQPKEPA